MEFFFSNFSVKIRFVQYQRNMAREIHAALLGRPRRGWRHPVLMKYIVCG
jgi:hypothetical protein